MFAVKIVTGGSFPDATEYDEDNVLRFPTAEQAIEEAHSFAVTARGAVDIVDESDGRRIARRHVDGGIDYVR